MKSEKLNINDFEVPYSALGGIYLEAYSNRKITVQGRYSIKDYGDDILRLKFGKNYLVIMGDELRLHNVRCDEITVTGYIKNIEYDERREEKLD